MRSYPDGTPITDTNSNDLLSSVIEAAGGLERFNKISAFSVQIHRTGSFFALKGYTWPAHPRAYISTKTPRVTFHNFGGKNDSHDLRWIWTPQRIWKETPDGTVIESQDDPGKTLFEGHDLRTPWDDLHVLYFSGYALWNYFMAPFYFTWREIKTKELEPVDYHGQKWRVLEVTYPDDFPTHCRTQEYFFDDAFHLRRLNYSVEIAPGGIAKHYCFDERMVSGVLVPHLRRVVTEKGTFEGNPSAVLINFEDLKVREEGEAKL